jgi:hypothetical protein
MRLCLVATMTLVLSACGSKTEGEAAVGKAPATAPVPGAGDDGVAAVKLSLGAPLAQLRFVIDSRPEVDRTFRMQLVVSGATEPQLRLALQSDVLRVDPAGAALELSGSGAGGAGAYGGSQDFLLVGTQEGLAEVTVRLAAGEGAPETVYSIPVMVTKPGAPKGAPASDKPDPAAADDHGKPKKG